MSQYENFSKKNKQRVFPKSLLPDFSVRDESEESSEAINIAARLYREKPKSQNKNLSPQNKLSRIVPIDFKPRIHTIDDFEDSSQIIINDIQESSLAPVTENNDKEIKNPAEKSTGKPEKKPKDELRIENYELTKKTNTKKRKKLYIILGITALLAIGLGIMLSFILNTADSSNQKVTMLQSLNDPNQRYLAREYKAGFMQKCDVSLQGKITFVMNDGSVISEDGAQNFTFIANTDIVSEPSQTVLFSFLLIPEEDQIDVEFSNLTIFLGFENFNFGTFAELNIQMIFCETTFSGIINYCKFPNYLSGSAYSLILSIVRQLLPDLDKSLYLGRKLQENPSDTKYSLQINPNSNTLELSNVVDTNVLPGSGPGNKSFVVVSSTTMDAENGQPIKSGLNLAASTFSDVNNEDSIVAQSNITSEMAIEASKSELAPEFYLLFRNKLKETCDFFLHISPTTNMSSLNDFYGPSGLPVSNTTNNSRLLLSNNIITKIDQTLFEKDILDMKFGTYISFSCNTQDICTTSLFAKVDKQEIPIYEKEMESKAVSIAIKLCYYKTATINNIKKASEVVLDISKKTTKLLDGLNRDIKFLIQSLVDPFLVSLAQLTLVTKNINTELQNLKFYFDGMKIGLDTHLKNILYSLDKAYQDRCIEIDNFDNWVSMIDSNMKTLLSDAFITQNTANLLYQVLDNFLPSVSQYYNSITTDFSSAIDSWTNTLSTYEKMTDAIAYNPSYQSKLNPLVLNTLSQIMKYYIRNQKLSYITTIQNYITDYKLRLEFKIQDYKQQWTSIITNSKVLISSKISNFDANQQKKYQLETIFAARNFQYLFDFLSPTDFSQVPDSGSFYSVVNKWVTFLNKIFHPAVQVANALNSSFTTELKSSFQTTRSSIQNYVSNLNQSYSNLMENLKNDSQSILNSCRQLTDINFNVNSDQVRSAPDALNIFKDFSNAEDSFNNFKNASNNFLKLKNSPFFDIQSYFDLGIGKAITYLKGNFSVLNQTFIALRDDFGAEVKVPGLIFDATYDFSKQVVSDTITRLANLPQFIRTTIDNIANNQLTPLQNIKTYLLNKLSSLDTLPTRIGSFKYSTTIPTPQLCFFIGPISFCLQAEFTPSIEILLDIEVNTGKVDFQVTPIGTIAAKLSGKANILGVSASVCVKGVLFEGRLPILFSITYLSGIEANIKVRLEINMLKFEVVVYGEIIFFDPYEITKISLGDGISKVYDIAYKRFNIY